MIVSIDSRIAQAVGQLMAADTNLRITDIQSTIGNLASSVRRKSDGHSDGDVCLLLIVAYPSIHRAIRTSSMYSHERMLLYSKRSRNVSSNQLMVTRSRCILMTPSFFRIDEKSFLNDLRL